MIHAGNGEWLIVDSCLGESADSNAPLDYLAGLNVNLAEQVALVVASHWHDDHIRGLARVVEACPGARFVCSTAMRSSEFVQVVKLHEDGSVTRGSGVAEFNRVLAVLEKRGSGQKLEWAVADRRLYHRTAGTPAVEVFSLSPGDQAVTRAFKLWRALLDVEEIPRTRLLSGRPNEGAVVLWVAIGVRKLLLGSDIEEAGVKGWTAVLGSFGRPTGKAAAYKVSHHGSANGDHSGVWNELLESERVAVVTPHVRGSVSLPTKGDVRRILGYTPKSYITAPPVLPQTYHRDSMVMRTIKETTRYICRAQPALGHVRLRAPADSAAFNEWRVELFGKATELSNIA